VFGLYPLRRATREASCRARISLPKPEVNLDDASQALRGVSIGRAAAWLLIGPPARGPARPSAIAHARQRLASRNRCASADARRWGWKHL